MTKRTLLEGIGGNFRELAGDKETEALDTSSATPESSLSVSQTSFKISEVVALAKSSLDFLAGLAAPLTFKFCFPFIFQTVWIWLLANAAKIKEFPQLALGLPRGFAKTTVIKLFVLYCILFTDKKFILVISSTSNLAQNIIFDIAAFLDEPNIKAVFGDWRAGMVQDTLAMKKFGYRGRNIVLAGIGAGTSLRGLNINNERPDIMIFEDIQTREDAESEVLSNALMTWMVGTAMKAKSPAGCMFLFIANMYPTKHSILRKLKVNPTWTSFITGGILDDGTSLWEELHPIANLLKEFENDLAFGRPEVFYSEVLNDENAAANNLVDFSRLPDLPYSVGQIPEGNFVLIDPAGYKKKSDEVAIGYFEVHSSKPVLMKLIHERMSPAECIRRAITYCLENNCRFVVIEGVGYQTTLAYWFRFICEQQGISGIKVADIHPGGYTKNARILSMLQSYKAGEIYVHPTHKAEAHAEISAFNPLKQDNTDNILDLLTYAPQVIATYEQDVRAMGEIELQESDVVEIDMDNCVY